jgi:hypothetical protein
MFSQGSEFGLSSTGLTGPALDWPPYGEKQEFLEYVQWLVQLKELLKPLQFGTFELPGTSYTPVVEYMSSDGKQFLSLPEFAQHFGRGERSFKGNDEGFLGTLYSKHPGGWKGFERNPGSVPAPVLVVRRAGATTSLPIPDAVAGWKWMRVFDSQQEGADAFLWVDMEPIYLIKPFDKLKGPGVVAYTLARA